MASDLLWSLLRHDIYGTHFSVMHCLVLVEDLNPQYLLNTEDETGFDFLYLHYCLEVGGKVGANSTTVQKGWPDFFSVSNDIKEIKFVRRGPLSPNPSFSLICISVPSSIENIIMNRNDCSL